MEGPIILLFFLILGVILCLYYYRKNKLEQRNISSELNFKKKLKNLKKIHIYIFNSTEFECYKNIANLCRY